MAAKGLKLIQNGVITFAPDTPAVRSGIEGPGGHNQKTKKSSRSAQEHITILQATDEEVEKYLYPTPKKRETVQSPSFLDEISQLKKENSELKSLMLNFMANAQNQTPIPQADQTKEEEKRKPGRPPANIQ